MFKLPQLPYAENALAPHISAQTMNFHYNKHHAGYVKKLNELVADTPMADMTLEEIIMETHGSKVAENKKIFNNAAQSWNHTFFWSSMTPEGGGDAKGDVAELIKEAFGDADGFTDAFTAAAEAHFGSGWVWLTEADGTLEILTTANAELPMTSGKTAVLVCDIWEHAYYLDYQNRKPDFVKTYLSNLINWDFVNTNLRSLTAA